MNRYFAVLLTGFVVLLVSGGSRFAIGLTLKPMAIDFDWSRSTISLAVFISLVVSSTCMYLSGRLADRFNLTHVLTGGLLISAMGIGLISYTSMPWLAFVLYGIIFAFGNGLTSLTPVGVLITRWFPNRIGLANAAAISGMGFGQLLMIAFLAIILVQSGWRPVYLWLGVANLMLVPFVLVVVKQWADKENSSSKSTPSTEDAVDFATARKTSHFKLLTIIYMICGFQDFFVATHIVAFSLDQGIDPLRAGNILALMGLMAVIGVILTGLWSDKSGPATPTIVCFIFRILLFSLIVFQQNTASIIIFALGYGLTFLSTAPLTVVFIRNAYGSFNLGATTGFISMAHQMAGGLGAFAGGVIFDQTGGYGAAFGFMLALSFAGVFYSWYLKQTPNNYQNSQA